MRQGAACMGSAPCVGQQGWMQVQVGLLFDLLINLSALSVHR